jgi:hypothetical protein
MEIYFNEKHNLLSVKTIPFRLEKDIQNLVESNLQTLFKLELVKSEFTIDKYRLDTLCFDMESKSFVIIEYKKDKNYSVIDQGFSYLSTVLENKGELILEYQEKLNTRVRKDGIDWSQIRIIFISPSFSQYQKDSINFKDLPIELYEIKQYENDIVTLNRIQSKSSSTSINELSDGGVIGKVKKEVKVYNESDLLNKCNEETLELWSKLQNRTDDLDDINYVPRKHYIGIRKNNTTVTYVHFYKTKLLLHIIRGNIYKGKKSKGFFTFDDPKNISKSGDHNFKDGTVRKYYEIVINKSDDIDYVMMLIKQKYNIL